MSNTFKEQVNQTLAGLDWTAADSRETLGMMKGDIRVKRRMSLAMAMALAVMALGMAFGLAEIIRYSVRDYHRLDAKTYEERVTLIQQEDRNTEVSLYLNDAVFDGERLVLAMEIQPVSGETVYLVPELTAKSGGKTIRPRVLGSRGGDFNQGFWVGKSGELGFTDGRYGFDAQIRPESALGDVNWQLTFHVLKPVWEVVTEPSKDGEGSREGSSQAEWAQQFREAYRNRKIMLARPHNLMMFIDLLPGQKSLPLAQRLQDSGAFTSAGSLQTDFVTPKGGLGIAFLTEKTLTLDGFKVHIERLDTSFMRMTYAFTITITDPAGKFQLYRGDRLIDFQPVVENNALRRVVSGGGVPDAHTPDTTARFTGEFIGTGEMPREITFKPFYYDGQGNPVALDTGAFTVPLK